MKCNPSRQATGVHRPVTPTGGRPVKKMTVVVRDFANLAITYAPQIPHVRSVDRLVRTLFISPEPR